MMITKLFGEIETEKRMNIIESGMVTHIRDSSTREGSVRESQVQSPMTAHKPPALIPGIGSLQRPLP